MGGGPEPTTEHLLIILPFPEPTEIVERIKKNHPHIDITYRNLTFVNFEDAVKEIPKGGVSSSGTESPAGQSLMLATRKDLLTFSVLVSELFEKATILCTLVALPKAPEDAPKLGTFAPDVDIQLTYCH